MIQPSNRSRSRPAAYPLFKRAFDFSLAGLALVCLLPLLVAIAAIALLVQGRPILFVQVRPGLNEQPFKVLKFRTMVCGPLDRDSQVERNETTRFGRVLRSMSLDELPQLINILRGDMSFVGPRPLLMEYLPLYSNHQKKRHNVRPGLTGLAQVEGRNQISWEKRLDLDARYAESQSLVADLRIVLKSVVIVISRKGVEADGSEFMPRFRGTNLGHP